MYAMGVLDHLCNIRMDRRTNGRMEKIRNLLICPSTLSRAGGKYSSYSTNGGNVVVTPPPPSTAWNERMDQEREDHHQTAGEARWEDDYTRKALGYQRPRVELRAFDEEELLQLQRNDPATTGDGLALMIDENNWIQGAGLAIGGSKYLLILVIDIHESEGQYIWLVDLWDGLSRNRSVEQLVLRLYGSELGLKFEGIASFLEHNTNLRSIMLSDETVTSSTYGSLVSALSKLNNGRLECVVVSTTNGTDEQTAMFFNSLLEHRNLTVLYLEGPNIGRVGCTAFANWFTNPVSSNIVTLKLEANDFDDYSITMFSSALIYRNTLISLYFSGYIDEPTRITNAGWRAFFAIFFRPSCSIEDLFLHDISICNEGVTYFGDALAVNQTLKYLHIGTNMSFTLAGWKSIAKCFRNPNTTLEELNLSSCRISTDGMVAIITALAGNSTLERLNLQKIKTIETATVYKALKCLLCDKTSISSTFSSNHTLHSIIRRKGKRIVGPSLELNRMKNKLEVARHKIFAHHISGEVIASCSLSQLPLNIFPHAMAWIGGNKIGFAPMHSVVCAFPMLFTFPITRKRRKL